MSRLRLLLFDINGTLVTKDKTKTTLVNAIQLFQALENEFKVKLFGDGKPDITKVKCAGGTDQSISFDVLRHANIITSADHENPSDELISKVDRACSESAHQLRQTIADKSYVYKRLRNVNELLSNVSADPQFRVALLTGNYAVNAKLKLQGAGIDTKHFQYDTSFDNGLAALEIDQNCDPRNQQKNEAFVGSFGSDHRVRRCLPPIARDRFSQLIGHDNFDGIIIGDTPKDIDCAHFNGMKAVGVATGPYSVEELQQAGADRVLPDFSDLDATIQALQNV